MLLEREEGRERETLMSEKHDQLPFVRTQTRDQTHNLGVCPDQESNPQPFSYRMMFQPTEPHQPGLYFLFRV